MRRMAMMIFLMLVVASPVSAQQHYVALGDSLAAGQTPQRMIDAGYTDFIALRLASQGELASFTKQLAFSGFTTAQVLERVQEPYAQATLQQATLITISAGANDLLGLVSTNAATGEVEFNQLTADFALNAVRENMIQLIEELQQRAPQAELYIMGYYFPYPHVHEQQQAGLVQQLNILNTILQTVALEHDAQFVDVATSFNKQGKRYLPNATDVHPNFEGYVVMANAFLQQYGQPPVTQRELPVPNPMSFEEVLKQLQQKQQTTTVATAQLQKHVEDYIVPHGIQALRLLALN